MDVQWAIMNDPPETAGHSHFQLLNRIRSGIEGNEFVMHYQPVISGSGDRIIGCESLIRWQDSSNGRLLGPNAFIPVAEKDPVILDLGNWIFQHVAEQAARWKSEGLILDFYSINVAVPQLLQGSFAHRALRLWEKSGLSPEHLKIEITESLLAQKGETLEQNLSTLRSHGVSIAFDDFGTGYSSLAYLDSFPVDCIKVDRVFVQRSASSAAHASIIEAVGLMARQMDLTVIIEGIEDESNLSRIRSVTDVYGWQGYYFSPPLKSEDLPLFVYDFNPARAVQASS
ncbi:MAG TPA: hypothetical protein DEA96_03430 [Leptospiraceae bacterium]|nr:hypothetical protein [Leptospiraceae bacterium]